MVLSVIVIVIVGVAIFGPAIAPQDPVAIDLASAYQGPSAAHWLGTDGNGRDLLSRLIVGARTSILAPLLVIVIASLFGCTIGIVAAWYGGVVDAVISRFLDAVFAIPGLLLAILAAAVFGNGLLAPITALAVAYMPYFARLIRGAGIREVSMPYIAAFKISGMSGWRICVKHLLPNLSGYVISQATVSFGYAMVDLAMVSFLGLGVQPPSPDWGLMVSSGEASMLRGYPDEAIFAGLLIIITVVVFNVLGEKVDEMTKAKRS